MKKHLFSVFMLLLWVAPQLQAQTCGCLYAQQLQPASYYSQNDFNCYQYVRATFTGNHYGTWVPPASNSIGSLSANIISESNDPGVFEEVCDPADANVIVYNCGHAGVIVGSECVVEKVGYGSELRKYGINYGSCLPNSSTKFYKYIGSYWPYRGIDMDRCGYDFGCEEPPEPECNNQVVWYNTTTVLNTVNFTSNYFNQIWVDCDAANNITWQKISGNDVYHSCFSSCRGFYFYLNPGQSVTYKVTAKQGSTTLFTKNYTFYRSGGGGGGPFWLAGNEASEEDMIRFSRNHIENRSAEQVHIELYSLLGQRLSTFQLPAFSTENLNVPQQGVYLISVQTESGIRQSHKILLSPQ